MGSTILTYLGMRFHHNLTFSIKLPPAHVKENRSNDNGCINLPTNRENENRYRTSDQAIESRKLQSVQRSHTSMEFNFPTTLSGRGAPASPRGPRTGRLEAAVSNPGGRRPLPRVPPLLLGLKLLSVRSVCMPHRITSSRYRKCYEHAVNPIGTSHMEDERRDGGRSSRSRPLRSRGSVRGRERGKEGKMPVRPSTGSFVIRSSYFESQIVMYSFPIYPPFHRWY